MSGKLEYTRPEGEEAELLKKYFVTSYRPGFIKCKDMVLPEYYQLFGDRIREMDIRDDDIWVCSFPRSGTTWTQEMVWCIANDVDLEAAKEFLFRRFPFIEHSTLFDYRELMARRPEIEFPDYVLDSVGYVNKLASPRFIKTHFHFKLLPEKLQQNKTSAKIIYVARNSKDTCVSFYHQQCQRRAGYKCDLDTFCNLFLNGTVCFGPYWNHVLGYWVQKDNPNVLLLTYEEMKKDLRSVICKTAKFLGKTLSEEQIEKLLVHLSFESMKNNRAVNNETIVERNEKFDLMVHGGSLIRSGQVDGWKEIMSPAMSAHFDKWDAENVKGFEFIL